MSLSDLDNKLIFCSHFPLPLTQTIINPGPKQVNYNMNTQRTHNIKWKQIFSKANLHTSKKKGSYIEVFLIPRC